MNPDQIAIDIRPWYREPWVWLIIALPAISVIGCAITIWLAITRPDYLVVDDIEYKELKAGLHAEPDPQKARPGPSQGQGQDNDNSDG